MISFQNLYKDRKFQGIQNQRLIYKSYKLSNQQIHLYCSFSININRTENMNNNIWNLSQTKTSFFIRQRTQAQRRHLNTLKKMKSNIDMNNCTHSPKMFQPVNKSRAIQSMNHQKQCQFLQNSRNQRATMDQSPEKYKMLSANTSYIDNLRISSSLSRIRQNKQIEKQNTRLIQRLIKAKPSISEIQFKKNHLSHLKYKQNILKYKYINPDYSQEVKFCKKSASHLLLKPIQNLTKIKISKTVSRVKTQGDQKCQSQNYRFIKPLQKLQNKICR